MSIIYAKVSNISYIFAVDFDGTCVTHKYPEMGEWIGAAPILRKIVEKGHRIMLWTMRGNKPGENTLNDAIKWFEVNNIPLWGINENIEQKASGWSNSNKQYAQYYIDDAAIGCPLVFPKYGRPYVDWDKIEEILKEEKIL